MKIPARLLATLTVLSIVSPLAGAYEIRLTEKQLQQEVDARMPVTQQQGLFTLVLSNPVVTLVAGDERLRISTDARLLSEIGLQSRGKVTLDGKIRYEKSNYSFYLDEPVIRQLSIDGVPPSAEPQLIQLAQQALVPALKDQPVYTLSDQEMTQNMARMMLKSMRITSDAVVLDIGF